MRAFIVCCAILCVFIHCLDARIAIYGDTRGDAAIHASIVSCIATYHPDATFHTGDLSERGTQQQDYNLFLNTVAPLGHPEDFYPVRGNHDRDKGLFLKNFPHLAGSSWYSVMLDSIHIIVLDSVENLKPGSEQYRWLESQLQSPDGLPIVVMLHHPLFSSGAHGATPGLALYLSTLFQNHAVRAVFSGHEHSYERSIYDGIPYIVSGGGGSPLRESRHGNTWSQVFYIGYHYIICDREGSILKLSAYTIEGRMIDRLDIPLR